MKDLTEMGPEELAMAHRHAHQDVELLEDPAAVIDALCLLEQTMVEARLRGLDLSLFCAEENPYHDQGGRFTSASASTVGVNAAAGGWPMPSSRAPEVGVAYTKTMRIAAQISQRMKTPAEKEYIDKLVGSLTSVVNDPRFSDERVKKITDWLTASMSRMPQSIQVVSA